MIRVAVVGAGAWGLNHVRVLASAPGAELVLVVDPDPATEARVRALAPGARHAVDLDQALAPSIDALVIASPAPTHAALAERALRAGKHVLVEKPLALSLPDAIGLRDLAAAQGRVAMVGHLMLFHPVVEHLRGLVTADALGTVHCLHATRVNLGRHRCDENVLWSFGPHDLAVFDYLLGEQLPEAVSACGQSMLSPGIEDVAFLTLTYPGGVLAHVHLSWLHPRKERRLTVVGSRKMAEFDDVAVEKLRIYDKGYDSPPAFTQFAQYLTLRDGEVLIPNIPMSEPLEAELRHFLGCIRDGSGPRADLGSAVRVTRVLAAAQQSMAAGGSPVAPQR